MKNRPVKEYCKEYYPEKESCGKIEIGKNHRSIFNTAYRNKNISHYRNKPCRIKVLDLKIMLDPETDCFKHKNCVQYNT